MVYAAEGDGIVGLRLSDGEPVSHWAGASGFDPSRAAAADGIVYVSYEGPCGTGTGCNMLFRAYRASDGHKMWEKVHKGVFPQTLELVGDRLHLQGQTRGIALDIADGEKAGDSTPCSPLVVRGDELFCKLPAREGTEVRDARTLGERRRLPVAVAAVGEAGPAVEVARDEVNVPTMRGVDPRSGEVRWTGRKGVGDGAVVLAGDHFLVIGHDGVQAFSRANGQPLGKAARFRGWPRLGRGTEMRPIVLAAGGTLCLVFDDGTVLTSHLP
ncbi:hypothetical protein [Streptomyces sp. XD-27]|uniref:hypothetical protein n=1 Tax=Streptomyces sp. XD-27 TaxID=3062779 RepID=UPI0026F43BF6|nr:hypothetical protein [Streptomyces sp. XD-27]WKX74579.1 hypothetical protein Q3Y56_16160 [Streptomyces sp. XD-27]